MTTSTLAVDRVVAVLERHQAPDSRAEIVDFDFGFGFGLDAGRYKGRNLAGA